MMRVLQRYGDLLVVVPRYRPVKGRGQASLMICLCLQCGRTSTPVASNVRSGRTTSCGHHGKGDHTGPREAPKTYTAIHHTLKRYHGKATNYQCADCPKSAQEWSYVGNSPFEQVGIDSSQRSYLAWSPYMRDYTPRCIPCHRKHDEALAAEREANHG